jgi:ATP-binding cassette subfamily F protein 3
VAITASIKHAAPAPEPEPVVPEPEAVKATAAPAKRLNPIKLKQLEERVALIEGELSAVDARIAEAEEHLGHYTSAEDSQRTASLLDDLRGLRTALTTEWEELATQLEEQASPA